MADKWTEETAKSCLKRAGIDVKGRQLTLKRAGLKVWGAIDYLCNHHQYSYMKESKDNG
jgi:hypothetical protein